MSKKRRRGRLSWKTVSGEPVKDYLAVSDQGAKREGPRRVRLRTKSNRDARSSVHVVKDCRGKIKYPRFCDAVHAADEFNEAKALVAAPMVVYWCKVHRVFHKGHNRRMKPWAEAVYLGWSRARAWVRSKTLSTPVGTLGAAGSAQAKAAELVDARFRSYQPVCYDLARSAGHRVPGDVHLAGLGFPKVLMAPSEAVPSLDIKGQSRSLKNETAPESLESAPSLGVSMAISRDDHQHPKWGSLDPRPVESGVM